MKWKVFYFFSILFILGCLKAKRSPYDVSTPSGAAISQAMTLLRLKPSELPPSQLSPPVFTPGFGLITQLTNISISTSPPDASIYYTLDGTTPTINSNLYTTPLENVWALSGKKILAFSTKSGYLDSPLVSGVYSYPPLKTGQTSCWDGFGSPIPCSGTMHDGDLQIGVAKGYTDNGDGTVTDHATGLVWQKCSAGLSGLNCSLGIAMQANRTNAINYCSSLNLAGKTWRLPNIEELQTLVDYGTTSGAINATYFPGTLPNPNHYWTSTEGPGSNMWFINFTKGEFLTGIATLQKYIRCVSGPSKEPKFNFTDNGDGTVKDNTTGLVWQKCSKGLIGVDCSSGTADPDSWTNAINYCSSLNLAGKTWRLPNINELNSLADRTKSSFIDTTFFPSNQSNYWSSTTDTGDSSNGWYVDFGNGEVGSDDKSYSGYYVRCVAGP